jgi:hypothetical protein
MPGSALRSLRAVWEDTFAPPLTRPGFANLIVIVVGWILTRGPHAGDRGAGGDAGVGPTTPRGVSPFFSRGTWDPDRLGLWVFWRIVAVFGDAGAVRIVFDDTLAPKKGAHVFGIGSLRGATPIRTCRTGCWASPLGATAGQMRLVVPDADLAARGYQCKYSPMGLFTFTRLARERSTSSGTPSIAIG